MTIAPYFASCPECDTHVDLDRAPATVPRAKWWPHCRDCGASMNVFRRQKLREKLLGKESEIIGLREAPLKGSL